MAGLHHGEAVALSCSRSLPCNLAGWCHVFTCHVLTCPVDAC